MHIYLTVEALTASLEHSINPIEFNLYQNYPNPFNPSTAIPFSVPLNQDVRLNIYDLLGKEVLDHTFTYGKNQLGNLVGAGVYFTD